MNEQTAAHIQPAPWVGQAPEHGRPATELQMTISLVHNSGVARIRWTTPPCPSRTTGATVISARAAAAEPHNAQEPSTNHREDDPSRSPIADQNASDDRLDASSPVAHLAPQERIRLSTDYFDSEVDCHSCGCSPRRRCPAVSCNGQMGDRSALRNCCPSRVGRAGVLAPTIASA